MYELNLTFRNKRDYNRFLRNLKNGKGTVVKPDHLVLGSGFGDFFKNAGKALIKSDFAKNLVDKGIKTIVNKGAEFVDSKTGNTGIATAIANPLGDIASQQAQAQMDKAGQGLKRSKTAKNIYGMGTNKGMSMSDRMALIRSYKNGKNLVGKSILSP